MDMGLVIKLVGGLFLLGAGARQLRGTLTLRRSDVKSPGTVVRVGREWDDEEQVWLYGPVIAFSDEQGGAREFTTNTSTTWETHQPGDQVTVAYPSGRPEAARLESGAHQGLRLVGVGIPAVFVVVGLVLLGFFVRDLLTAG